MARRDVRNVAILGSTGSIGRSALDVIASVRGLNVRVHSLACGSNIHVLADQVRRFQPERAVIADAKSAETFRKSAPKRLKVASGEDALIRLASDPDVDVVLMAVVGAAALRPTLAALKAGKTVALANKEALVMAGRLMTAAAGKHGGRIIPVDSEHSGAFQLMMCGRTSEIRRLIITGSGGALRNVPLPRLAKVTVKDALNHPTWDMGPKVTIDSATSMNKALELIEAHYLFDLPRDALAVWVHPQSLIHAIVEYRDGTTVLHASRPDMRLPIQYALGLSGSGRVPGPVEQVTSDMLSGIRFAEPDPRRMPAVELGMRVVEHEGTLGATLNAANEVAVEAFIEGKIPFTRIVRIVSKVMDEHKNRLRPSIDDVFAADCWARKRASAFL